MTRDIILICPTCKRADLVNKKDGVVCNSCATRYAVLGHTPVLINDGNSLFSRTDYIEPPANSDLVESANRRRFVPTVHEGAYDFTRYTLIGHRRLFLNFEDVSSGVLAGPGTVFAWSLEALIRCVLDRVLFGRWQLVAKLISRVIAMPFKYLDYFFLEERYADFSSYTFFLGKRTNEKREDSVLLSSYKGMNTFNHV